MERYHDTSVQSSRSRKALLHLSETGCDGSEGAFLASLIEAGCEGDEAEPRQDD
jgi:hypothetical protein